MMCTHHVEQMFVFTNAFRQDYCTIPFPFVTPYHSDRYQDQCFNCFLISPDGKIVPADYADDRSHDVWTRRCMQIDMVEISAGGSRIYCTAAYR
eukprot:scaffold16373_cov102-Skeletonema_dohrnii-CCMP3373.AAC.1